MATTVMAALAALSSATDASVAADAWSSVVQSLNGTVESSQLKEMGPLVWSTARPLPATAAGATAATVMISVDVTTTRQEIMGFGGAFTEAAGYVFHGLDPSEQERLVGMYWGSEGAGYSTGRIAMNSPDFAL
jgi:O-glycosyl hydrolase